jgi:hypothetical protein
MKQKLWTLIPDTLLYAGVLLLVAAVICWLANWRTLDNFSTGFFIAGVAALIFRNCPSIGVGDATQRYVPIWPICRNRPDERDHSQGYVQYLC